MFRNVKVKKHIKKIAKIIEANIKNISNAEDLRGR